MRSVWFPVPDIARPTDGPAPAKPETYYYYNAQFHAGPAVITPWKTRNLILQRPTVRSQYDRAYNTICYNARARVCKDCITTTTGADAAVLFATAVFASNAALEAKESVLHFVPASASSTSLPRVHRDNGIIKTSREIEKRIRIICTKICFRRVTRNPSVEFDDHRAHYLNGSLGSRYAGQYYI